MTKRKGMSQQEYEDTVRDDIYRFIVRPVVVLIAISVVSVFLEIFLDINYEYFKIIFTGIGGIPYLIYCGTVGALKEGKIKYKYLKDKNKRRR